MKRNPAHGKLLTFLIKFKSGDKVKEKALRQHMGWTENTLRTYEIKHMLAPFLLRINSDDFQSLRDGLSLTQKEIIDTFSQSRPKIVPLIKGKKFIGARGRYVLEEKIGEGAVGQVWKCENIVDRNKYAIKILAPRQDLLDPSVIGNVKDRFRREVKNGKTINHENIVRYLDSNPDNEEPFLVMELALYSLQRFLENGSLFDLKSSAKVIGSCIKGLEFLHSKKCVHRDVKPANILCFKRGYVLGDLGIVQWSDFNPAFTSAATITRASIQLGSWLYMAPEQRANPHNIFPESDIYSLGVTWYELLTKNLPQPDQIAAKRYSAPTKNESFNSFLGKILSYDIQDRPKLDEIENFIKTI